MALGATMHTFDVQLADVDRGCYENLTLRVARHPSETDAYMVTRLLAYCLEFEDGMWEADATSADGNRVDLRVDPSSGKVFAEDMVSTLSADDIKARLTAAGYSKVNDVDFEDGIWEAEAERPDGADVKIRLDPTDGRILGVEND